MDHKLLATAYFRSRQSQLLLPGCANAECRATPAATSVVYRTNGLSGSPVYDVVPEPNTDNEPSYSSYSLCTFSPRYRSRTRPSSSAASAACRPASTCCFKAPSPSSTQYRQRYQTPSRRWQSDKGGQRTRLVRLFFSTASSH